MHRRTATRALLAAAVVTSFAWAQEVPPAETQLPEPRLVGDRSPQGREKALGRFKGQITGKAVEAGLAWLARHAEPGGGWDADGFAAQCAEGEECTGIGKGQHGEEMPCPFDTPISALATMAFLGHGHLPGAKDDPYGEVVEKSLERLCGAGGTWGLALATQALAEAEVMERRGRWRDAVQRGADALLAQRQEDGGWAYAGGFRGGSDVPYTALVVQALVTARDAGIELPQDFAQRLDAYLDGLEVDKKGRLAYLKEGRRYGYTPTQSNAHCGAAIRCLAGSGTTGNNHRAHLSLISKEKPVWKISFREVTVPGRGKVPVQIGNLSMYQWWYGTIATFHTGGAAWTGWKEKLDAALVPHQETTGCAKGSWDPQGTYERQTGGRVFATALGVLMLEQPYRHRRLGE